MPKLISNQLKAMLVVEDISEQGVNVMQGNCFTVQHFSYACSRRRNDAGTPYGPTLPAYLDFTVKVASGNSGKVFFERMHQDSTFPYSFLFNADFNDVRRLSACEDAMIATGYIIDVEECYDKDIRLDANSEQMLIRARLLLSNIAYLGNERTLSLIITND